MHTNTNNHSPRHLHSGSPNLNLKRSPKRRLPHRPRNHSRNLKHAKAKIAMTQSRAKTPTRKGRGQTSGKGFLVGHDDSANRRRLLGQPRLRQPA